MLDHDRSKHLVAQTLLGQPIPRAVSGPLAVHYCARLAGVSMREYTLNPRALADCVICYHETFHPDAVWLSADTWVTAQAMGAAVAFPIEYQPMAGTGSPFVRSPDDIDRIPAPDPGSQGRWPMMLEAYLRQHDADPWLTWPPRGPTCSSWTIRSRSPRHAGCLDRESASGAISTRWPCWHRGRPRTSGGRPSISCKRPAPAGTRAAGGQLGLHAGARNADGQSPGHAGRRSR